MKYHALMALVCEDLTASTKVIDKMVRDGHEATSGQLVAVRFGRNVNLPWLIDLVRVSLPDYSIPEELLPEAPVPALASPTLFR
jgi:hypothetical protein